jgi:para-nitrobenzyl esterase
MYRSLLLLLCFFALGACTPFDNSSTRYEDGAIKTPTGVVQGQINRNLENVVVWSDIPFAQPPPGDLRWSAPRTLVAPEQFIVPKESIGCVQKASNYGGVEGKGEGIVGSEDCLYLDIKAPADFNKSYPVMVWIHGGGNTTGLKDYYDFSKLVASRGVVVVSTNYRLGALGWFSHPAIQGA